jgi:dipeptidyl aminopeptidase/acylaminoacyl peptidase
VRNRSARFTRFLLTDSRSFFTTAVTLVLTLLGLLAAPPALKAQGSLAPANKITLEDLVSLHALGEPVLSPDSKQFAFVRAGQIELLPADGGWPVTLTTSPGRKAELSWSPDSQTLAFVNQGSVWVVPVSGGKPAQITYGAVGTGDPRGASDRWPKWNSDGKWILFQSGRHGHNELWVVSADGKTTNYLATTEIYSGIDELDQVTEGDEVASDRFDPTPAWSPDGTRISYTERSRDFFSGKLKVLDFDCSTGTAKGAPLELYTARHDRGGAWVIDHVAWSPDGATLAFTLQDSGWDKVYLLSSHGGQPKQLTQGESEDGSPAFSPDGKSLAIVSNRGGFEESHIWIVPVDGSAPRRLANLPPGVEDDPQWSRDGRKIYFIRTTSAETPDLYVASTAGEPAARALTHTLPLTFEATGIAPPQVVHFKSKDGLAIAGILYLPLGYKTGVRYPTVIWAHGGPEGQDALTFSAWSLYLAQQGYVVFHPNFRGSTGYGEKFRNLNVEDSGGGETDDIGAGVAYLVGQGIADPKLVAIGGGSHGGTAVNYAVTKYPDLWVAALSLFGVADRATYIQRTNRNSAIRWETKFGGTPEEKPAVYRKADILPDVPKIKAPLLVLWGEEDPQVPPYESFQLVAALKKYNKTFVSFSYPHEGHGFSQPEHLLDALHKEDEFLRRYLLSPVGQSSTSTEEIPLGQK